MEELLKAIPVYLSSMVKFILGPMGGFAVQLHFITTVVATIAGMMTMVYAFTYFGEWIANNVINRLFKNRKLFTPNQKLMEIWRKYGLVGVALLTPVILTPIGGTLLAVSSGSPKERIILYMLISATIWSLIFTGAIYFIGKEVVPEFVK